MVTLSGNAPLKVILGDFVDIHFFAFSLSLLVLFILITSITLLLYPNLNFNWLYCTIGALHFTQFQAFLCVHTVLV